MRALLLSLILAMSGCALPADRYTDPLTPEQRLQLGYVYEQEGDYTAAVRQYEVAVEGLAGPVAPTWLANALYQLEEFERAELYYREALDRDPDHIEALNNLAWLYYSQQQRLAEAERLAARATRLAPDHSEPADTLRRIRAVRQAPPEGSNGSDGP